jgi:hypothetical protein
VTVDLGPVRFGLLFGLLAVLYGWSLGLVFGADEDGLRARFIAAAEAKRAMYVQKTGSEEGATAAIKRIDESAWTYFLRAHMHAGGIGSIAIGGSLVLSLLSVGRGPKLVASTLLGLGALGYPLFWMLSGLRAPELGSTAAAKESLQWLAIPSAGGLYVGALITFGLVVADLFVRRRSALVLAFVLAPALAAAQAAAPPAPGIADNSFLIEEAYNQEPGVIQHISAFTRFGEGDWAYSFTEEWPAPVQAHQLSVTLPVVAAGEHSGLGDAALNYRYQALDGSRGGVAFSPRLSVVFATGDVDRGLGSGGTGLQVNLPLSVHRGGRFVTHSNLGATWIPNARGPDRATASVRGFNAGQSVIWLARPLVHPLVELVWTRTESVVGPDATESADGLYISPGLRWAHNLKNGLQIVPGIAVPIGLGPSSGDTGVLLYLSFEHTLWK